VTIGVLGSGRGSNFRALIEAARTDQLSARFGLVASDNPTAGILGLARESGIPTRVMEEPRFRTRLSPEVEESLVSWLREAGCELIVLAGYMRLVKEPMLAAFPGRIVNVHPSLLPAFPGLEAWKQALDAGVAETGCTVHLVDAGMDTGPILAQARVPVLPGDSPASLHARIQEAEHRTLPAVVAELCKKFAGQ
jgi:phosphoribosylglycinamide formyltransferase 1